MPPAAAPPPESPNRHIPPELIEKILLHLPIKSLLRFSSVSTSWNSTITSPHFAATRGGARAVLIINDHPSSFNVRDSFCCPVPDTVGLGGALSPLVCPFWAGARLTAFCDDMLCVVVEKCLYLWNPSTGSHKRLPAVPRRQRLLHGPSLWQPVPSATEVTYGLGYDAVLDDYKLLKISRVAGFSREREKSLLYSLKSDSWKVIKSYLIGDFYPNCNGLFVNNALHWIPISYNYNRLPRFMSALISFDFSSEEFRVLPQPIYSPELNLKTDVVDVANLRSKLCVFVNYKRTFEDTRFVVWAMEEYGVFDTWTKLYEIRYEDIPPVAPEFRSGTWFTLRPMYVYEDGRVLIWATSGYKKWTLIWYKDGKVVGHSEVVAPFGSKAVPARGSSRVRAGFVYVETLVSLTKWARNGAMTGVDEQLERLCLDNDVY